MTDKPDRLRLFFALWPDAATLDAIVRQVQPWMNVIGGRAVSSANLHVTLAFLGDVAADRLAAVEGSAAGIRASPFALRLQQVDLWRRARVLVLQDPDPPTALLEAVTQLQGALRQAGFPIEDRPYRMHVTLARNVPRDGPLPTALPPMAPIPWPVRSFVLVRSRVNQSGSEYEVLREWQLASVGEARKPGS